jgi:hypothetical protein
LEKKLGKRQSKKKEKKRINGQHEELEQRRTQESPARSAQENQSGEAQENAGLRARIEEAQSEEDGPRTSEAVEQLPAASC